MNKLVSILLIIAAAMLIYSPAFATITQSIQEVDSQGVEELISPETVESMTHENAGGFFVNTAESLQSWSQNHANLNIFLLFVGAGLWIFCLRKRMSRATTLCLASLGALLVNFCGFCIMTTLVGTQSISGEYFYHLLIMAVITVVAVISASGITCISTDMAGLSRKASTRILKFMIFGAFAVAIATMANFLIEGGIHNGGTLSLSFAKTLMVIYSIAILGVAVYQIIKSASYGDLGLGLVTNISFALCGTLLMLSMLIFFVYALFLTVLLVVVMIIAGIKSPADSAHLVDQWGNKIYGSFHDSDIFVDSSGRTYRRNGADNSAPWERV